MLLSREAARMPDFLHYMFLTANLLPGVTTAVLQDTASAASRSKDISFVAGGSWSPATAVDESS